jgi:transcriptional regulator with XRE-family HTH domain
MSLPSRVLRHARRRAGLTQRALAALSGIPQETIARIEAGRTDPRVGTLDRLLKACGWGLEILPRPGEGVDRTLYRLDLPPAERARVAAESNDVNLRALARMIRVDR